MSRDPDAAFAAARAADLDVFGREQLSAHVVDLRIVRAWVDSAEIRATRRGAALAEQGSAGAPEATNARLGHHSSKAAHAINERTALCDEMPQFESALKAGAVSAAHVDAVARAANGLDKVGRSMLVESASAFVDEAARTTVDAFERSMRQHACAIATATSGSSDAEELDAQRRRSSVKRWVDKITGMHHTHLELDPLRDTKLWRAVNRQLATCRSAGGNRKTPWSQMQVDAFVDAVNVGGTGATVLGEVGVLISYARLADDANDGGVCETDDGTPLPVSTVRRMCCDALVYPVVLGTHGEVLDVGRTRRTATRSQRRALAAMHRSCAEPDCTVAFDACRIHHVRYWWRDCGPTDLANLLPLCEQHHHLVHEGGWKLTMTPDRVATWSRPDGSVHQVGSTINRIDEAPVTLVDAEHVRPMLC